MMCIARKMPSKKTSSNDTMAKKTTQKVESVPDVQTTSPVLEEVQTTAAPSVPKKLRVKKEVVKTAPVESVSATQVVDTPVLPEVSAAPVAEVQTKKPRKKAEKKTASPVEVAPVVSTSVEVKTEAVVSTPASEQLAASETTESASVQSIFESLISQNETLLTAQKNLILSLKKAYKAFEKQSKDAEKKRSRKTSADPEKKRQPSGFLMPTSISDTLCDFLGVPHGSKVSRTSVTNQINTYIREHSLHVPDNKRSFVPDAKLSAVFGPLHEKDKEVGFCYFNLQRYLKPHFVSSAVVTETTASA